MSDLPGSMDGGGVKSARNQPSGDVSAHAAANAEPSAAWVFVVTASSGEWSDRTEWPICAVWSEDSAQAKVEELTERVRAARAMAGEVPNGRYADSEAAWERYWKRERRALKTIEDIGGSDFDIRFHASKVPLAEPLSGPS